LVKIIDVVRNRQRTHDFFHDDDSHLRFATPRVLVVLSREEVAERAGLCRHSIRK
jgi:hypothetical protein